MSDSVPRITEIRAIPLQEGPYVRPLNTARNHYTLIEVRTDAGITGIGSAYTSTDLVRAALGLLEPQYCGEVAIEPERLHEKLEQTNFWMGRGGTVTHTISGIDIALWDIFGQVTGQPIARLLGGYYRDRVKPYTSLSMSRGQMEADIEAYQAAKIAEGEQQAAVQMAVAIRTKAEAEKDAATLRATGEQAQQMVPVNVTREQVSVDAARVQDVEAARVQVLRNELSAKAEYEQISVELEKALAEIEARKEVGVAFAHSFGDAFSNADVDVYGSPETLATAMSAFGKAAGIGAFMDGLNHSVPDETMATIQGLLQRLAPGVASAPTPAAEEDKPETDEQPEDAQPAPE